MIRAAHIVATIDDLSAGPSYSVPALASGLLAHGLDVSLHTLAGWRGCAADPGSSGRFPAERHQRHRHDFASVPVVGGLGWSEDLRRKLDQLAVEADILHTHGLWLMPNVFPSWSARRRAAHAGVVLSPRGMLGGAALRFSAAKKRLFWHLFQRRALEHVALIHATGLSEYEEIRAAGLRNPVAVIPNGIEVPEATGRVETHAGKTVLSLGRIHPKKGLDRLLRAWGGIAARHSDWTLRIAGSDEGGHASELLALAEALSLPRVTIEGPLFGVRKSDALREAGLFVLASLNENFAMTVAEALAAGVPVVSTKGAPWAGLESHGCGWWIDHGVDPMAAALDAALSLSADELRRMGALGRTWMREDYGWDGIAAQMADVYAWVSGSGDRPASVVID